MPDPSKAGCQRASRMQWPDKRADAAIETPSRTRPRRRNAQTPLRSYRSHPSARSSVVNGSLRGPKERRSFKPKVASSNLVGRIPRSSGRCREGPVQSQVFGFGSQMRSGGVRAVPLRSGQRVSHPGHIGAV
jgi:hypothetical protein